MPELNYASFSWRIIGDHSATKQCDKSFFDYCVTGVPRDICWFFGVDDLSPGDRKDVTLHYDGKSYAAYFTVDQYSRVRLSWETALGNSVAAYKVITPYPLALYEKVDEVHYNVHMLVGTERLLYRNAAEWIVPSNPKIYDAAGAFYDLIKVDWHQTRPLANIEVDDIVYIYTSAPVKAITHQCVVNKVGIPSLEISDAKYYVGGSDPFSSGPFVELQCVREFDALDGLTLAGLREHGLNSSMQGPLKVKNELYDHMQAMVAEQQTIERLAGGPEHYMGVSRGDFSEVDERVASQLDDDELKAIAIKHQATSVEVREVTTKQRQRNPYVAEYAKRRANGRCQLCGNPAPFADSNGKPYLESHHLVWLANGGTDTIDNTVALCPNCHRKMHVLNDARDVEKLKTITKNNADN